MKIFLDANILFSASLPGSRTGRFIAVMLKRAEVVTSAYAAEEARRNLARHDPDALAEFWRLIGKLHLVSQTQLVTEANLPEKDRPILGAATTARCTHLLTGDFRHFGPLLGRMISGVKVVSMQMLVEEFLVNGWVEGE